MYFNSCGLIFLISFLVCVADKKLIFKDLMKQKLFCNHKQCILHKPIKTKQYIYDFKLGLKTPAPISNLMTNFYESMEERDYFPLMDVQRLYVVCNELECYFPTENGIDCAISLPCLRGKSEVSNYNVTPSQEEDPTKSGSADVFTTDSKGKLENKEYSTTFESRNENTTFIPSLNESRNENTTFIPSLNGSRSMILFDLINQNVSVDTKHGKSSSVKNTVSLALLAWNIIIFNAIHI